MVFSALLDRHTMDPNGKNMSVILRGQRDNIRRLLKRKKAIKSVSQFESLFVCTMHYTSMVYLALTNIHRPGFQN